MSLLGFLDREYPCTGLQIVVLAAGLLGLMLSCHHYKTEAEKDVWSGHVYGDVGTFGNAVAVPMRRTLAECRRAAEHIIDQGVRYEPGNFPDPGYECGSNCEPWPYVDGVVEPDALMVCEEMYGTPGTGSHNKPLPKYTGTP